VYKNGRLTILHPSINFVGATRLAIRRAIFVLPGAALLTFANSAPAQETVYIGGSGQLSVEINIGILDNRPAPRRVSTILQHPGVVRGGLPPVTLRPPPETPTPAASGNTSTKMKVKTEANDASDLPAVKLKAPEPGPMPEPMPTVAADKPLNKKTAEKTTLTDTSQSKPTAKPKAGKKAAEPLTEAKAKNTRIAALDPTEAPKAPGDAIQILFPADESLLPQGAQASLAAIATLLGQDETLRLQLKAYAGGGADAASHSRRLSLSRALSVRSELIEQGVRSTRIDVRALGNKSESRAKDRVDIILVKR